MTKPSNPVVRLFTSGAQDARPTIETPAGAIYAGTPQAKQWQDLQAWAVPLIDLADSFATRTPEKSQLVADIAGILSKLPEDQAPIVATLHDLSAAVQDRLSNHTQTNFTDVGGAYAYHVATLRGQATAAKDGLMSLASFAPRPPRADAREPDPGQALGTGLYKQLNG